MSHSGTLSPALLRFFSLVAVGAGSASPKSSAARKRRVLAPPRFSISVPFRPRAVFCHWLSFLFACFFCEWSLSLGYGTPDPQRVPQKRFSYLKQNLFHEQLFSSAVPMVSCPASDPPDGLDEGFLIPVGLGRGIVQFWPLFVVDIPLCYQFHVEYKFFGPQVFYQEFSVIMKRVAAGKMSPAAQGTAPR